MSKHSLDELKRQRDNAKSKHQQSAMELAASEKRLHDAMCRDTGLMGKVVTTRNDVKVLIHDIDFSGQEPWSVKGFALKKDGSISFSERRVYHPFVFAAEGKS